MRPPRTFYARCAHEPQDAQVVGNQRRHFEVHGQNCWPKVYGGPARPAWAGTACPRCGVVRDEWGRAVPTPAEAFYSARHVTGNLGRHRVPRVPPGTASVVALASSLRPSRRASALAVPDGNRTVAGTVTAGTAAPLPSAVRRLPGLWRRLVRSRPAAPPTASGRTRRFSPRLCSKSALRPWPHSAVYIPNSEVDRRFWGAGSPRFQM